MRSRACLFVYYFISFNIILICPHNTFLDWNELHSVSRTVTQLLSVRLHRIAVPIEAGKVTLELYCIFLHILFIICLLQWEQN